MTPDQMIYDIGSRLGQHLTEEEQHEVEQWTNGRELSHLVDQPGWQIVLNMLRSYAQHATDDLLRLTPGATSVPQAHAAAAALHSLVNMFLQDVDQAIQVSRTVPDIIRASVSGVPPEAL